MPPLSRLDLLTEVLPSEVPIAGWSDGFPEAKESQGARQSSVQPVPIVLVYRRGPVSRISPISQDIRVLAGS